MHSHSRVIMLTALLMASCATVAPKDSRILPPVELLQDCAEPPGAFQTNGALAGYLIELRDALRGCNADKRALREWAK